VFSLILYLSIVGLALYGFVTWVQRTFVFWHKDQVLKSSD
jgi:NitT/TauT family transport system permease protein